MSEGTLIIDTITSTTVTFEFSPGGKIRDVYVNGSIYERKYVTFDTIFNLIPNTAYDVYLIIGLADGVDIPTNHVYFTTLPPPLSFGINWFFSP